ncbi:hypothetical protein EJ06DRAFT_555676 [Trichodelitschia bisporula]|uniref:Uncharacterized protein n=1 Tax=Trichodelitschia bisporula TaxID=703511 RepID=A0A6G1I1B6_9PEZI|nr:hypothetical protein EJ06DRAFT_555676 [Trichodelitschia bisporula]
MWTGRLRGSSSPERRRSTGGPWRTCPNFVFGRYPCIYLQGPPSVADELTALASTGFQQPIVSFTNTASIIRGMADSLASLPGVTGSTAETLLEMYTSADFQAQVITAEDFLSNEEYADLLTRVQARFEPSLGEVLLLFRMFALQRGERYIVNLVTYSGSDDGCPRFEIEERNLWPGEEHTHVIWLVNDHKHLIVDPSILAGLGAKVKRSPKMGSYKRVAPPSWKHIKGAPSFTTTLPQDIMIDITLRELLIYYPEHVMTWPGLALLALHYHYRVISRSWGFTGMANQINKARGIESGGIDPSNVRNRLLIAVRQVLGEGYISGQQEHYEALYEAIDDDPEVNNVGEFLNKHLWTPPEYVELENPASLSAVGKEIVAHPDGTFARRIQAIINGIHLSEAPHPGGKLHPMVAKLKDTSRCFADLDTAVSLMDPKKERQASDTPKPVAGQLLQDEYPTHLTPEEIMTNHWTDMHQEPLLWVGLKYRMSDIAKLVPKAAWLNSSRAALETSLRKRKEVALKYRAARLRRPLREVHVAYSQEIEDAGFYHGRAPRRKPGEAPLTHLKPKRAMDRREKKAAVRKGRRNRSMVLPPLSPPPPGQHYPADAILPETRYRVKGKKGYRKGHPAEPDPAQDASGVPLYYDPPEMPARSYMDPMGIDVPGEVFNQDAYHEAVYHAPWNALPTSAASYGLPPEAQAHAPQSIPDPTNWGDFTFEPDPSLYEAYLQPAPESSSTHASPKTLPPPPPPLPMPSSLIDPTLFPPVPVPTPAPAAPMYPPPAPPAQDPALLWMMQRIAQLEAQVASQTPPPSEARGSSFPAPPRSVPSTPMPQASEPPAVGPDAGFDLQPSAELPTALPEEAFDMPLSLPGSRLPSLGALFDAEGMDISAGLMNIDPSAWTQRLSVGNLPGHVESMPTAEGAADPSGSSSQPSLPPPSDQANNLLLPEIPPFDITPPAPMPISSPTPKRKRSAISPLLSSPSPKRACTSFSSLFDEDPETVDGGTGTQQAPLPKGFELGDERVLGSPESPSQKSAGLRKSAGRATLVRVDEGRGSFDSRSSFSSLFSGSP